MGKFNLKRSRYAFEGFRPSRETADFRPGPGSAPNLKNLDGTFNPLSQRAISIFRKYLENPFIRQRIEIVSFSDGPVSGDDSGQRLLEIVYRDVFPGGD